MRGCFVEKFFGKLPGERARDVLLEETLERMRMFGKNLRITQQTMDHALVLVCLAVLCWSSLGFADASLR